MESIQFIQNEKQIDFNLKIVITGKVSIGKTIFVNRLRSNNDNYYMFKAQPIDYVETIGYDFIVNTIKYHNKIFRMHIWDLSGNLRYKSIIDSYFYGTNTILIFFDAFDRDSFEIAKNIYEEKSQIYQDTIFCLIRSKYGNSEKELKDFVSDEEALEFADRNKLFFAHISCFEKYETGIKELISLILNKYLKKIIDFIFYYY